MRLAVGFRKPPGSCEAKIGLCRTSWRAMPPSLGGRNDGILTGDGDTNVKRPGASCLTASFPQSDFRKPRCLYLLLEWAKCSMSLKICLTKLGHSPVHFPFGCGSQKNHDKAFLPTPLVTLSVQNCFWHILRDFGRRVL